MSSWQVEVACGSRSSEPRNRASWTLAPSVHQADIDHGAWSSRRGDQHAYPPIWSDIRSMSITTRTVPHWMICAQLPFLVVPVVSRTELA